MFKEKMLKTMWTSQVQKHTEHHKHGVYKDATYIVHKEITIFLCFSVNKITIFLCFSVNKLNKEQVIKLNMLYQTDVIC